MKKFFLILVFLCGPYSVLRSQPATVGIWYSTWYISNGKYNWIDGHGVGSNNQFLKDVNGDGKDDAIVYFDNTGTWYVALSTGSSYSQYSQWISGHGVGSNQQLMADFTGDGMADALVLFNSSGAAYVATSSGIGFNSYSQWINNFGTGADKIMAGDVNGDMKIDLIAYFASTGKWDVALSNGSSFDTPITWISGHGIGSGSQFLGDFNGDGKADALAVFSSGDGYVALSNGNTFDGYSKWSTGTLTSTTAVMIGDINQDLRRDIIFYSSDGTWNVSYSDTNNTFGAKQGWKSFHTINAGNVFVGDPLGENKIAAVSFLNGVWNVLPNSSNYWKPFYWNSWDAWNIKYLPLTQGIYKQYDSGDTLVIQEHLAELTGANIDYLLMDETNNIYVENSSIFNRAQAVAHEIKKWNANPANKNIFYAFAVGGMQFSGDPNTLEYEAGEVWNQVVNNPSNGGPATYFMLNGKPLLVCYYGQQSYLDAWNAMVSHPWTQYFTIRWCNGTNLSTPDLYGWGIPNGSISSTNLMEVMPGWNNHQGSFTSRIYNSVEGDFYKKLCWDKVLAQLPGTVIINSYNEFAEETAVQTSNTSLLNGNSEMWSTPDKYWKLTTDYISQYRTAKVNQPFMALASITNKDSVKNRFLIFPNPVVGGHFTISSKGKNSPYSVAIFNLQGKLVYRKGIVFNDLTVNSQLKAGFYLIKVICENKRYSMKLAVE